jgi:uncharacterized protein (DUF1697 family)
VLRMSRLVAFLRGMNVGGHRLSNEELRRHFAALGFAEVATFRASGNVVFAVDAGAREAPRALERRIEQGLAERLGYAVPTFVRADAQVRAIAAARPFDPERVLGSAGKLQVSLLGASPPRALREQVLALAGEEDLLAFGERELYWLPSGGLLESALQLELIDGLLGPSTRRTKGTIELIAAKHCGG